MGMFEYNALTGSGRLMTGTIEAGSTQQAQEILEEMNLRVNELVIAKKKASKVSVGKADFMIFNQQLASIASAGIPLERSFRELAKDAGSASIRRLINRLADDMESGMSLDAAVKKNQKAFPPLYERILEAGITSGRLSELLISLNRNLETVQRTRRIIVEAICYPAVVLTLAALIFTFILITVVPVFETVLGDMISDTDAVPAATRVMFSLSRNVYYIWAVILPVIFMLSLIWFCIGRSAGGRRLREGLYMRIPLIGRVWHRGAMARMSDAMSVLVQAGCTMPQCLLGGADASGSERIKAETGMLAKAIENGSGILEAGQFCRTLPRLFLYSIQLGGQRNQLEDNLRGLAQMYTDQTLCYQGRLQAFLMPLLILFVGGCVGAMVLALFLPIVRIVTAMQ